MKKIITFVICVMLATAAWADVITLDINKPMNPASLEFGANGVWTGCYNDVDYTWLEFGDENGEFMLSHLIDGEGASWGGYYWDGFTPAIGGDQANHSDSWTTKYGGCMAGGGCVINEDGTVSADPEKPYFVAYYSSWAMEGPSNQVMFVDKDGNTEFEPYGVYVCNHPWPYYGCVQGDGFGRPFVEGDYFEIIAHGVASDGSEKTVSMNLVEFTDGELKAANDWTFFDLSSLGKVESVYFTLNSTDTGEWGMNTAAYFCMDKFQVKVADSGVEPIVTQGNILDVNKSLNPETIEYDETGMWTECYNDVDYTWLEFGAEDGEFLLSHLIDGEGASWGGYYWDGFTPAIGGDKVDHSRTYDGGWTKNFSGCMAGGGCVVSEDGTVTADPEKPYIVAYYSSWTTEGPSNQVMFVDNDGNTEFEPVGVYVCNHPWAYYNCLNGDGPARAFAEGDYFEITAHGVASDGSEKTVSMNLVEFTDGELKAANDWTFFDLSSLGKVESVYFTLNSTDTGDYGMNTAAYFCMDRFEVKLPEPVEEPPVFTGNILYVNNPINPETIEYGENGVWTGCYNDVDYTWLKFGAEDGEFLLSHLIDGEGASWGGYYWDGFTPAIGGDQANHSDSWTTNYGGCMAGGGCVVNEDGTVTADPKKPYIVAYYSSWAMEGPSNQVKFVDKDGNTEFEPVGVYVCNHPWPYYGCVQGDGFGRAFAEGDYFEIIAHGVASDGSEKTVSMNLVEFTDGELKAANDWTFFDLSSLGKVESVYFTLNSTDTGEYGMNTAAYFCMDKFEVKLPEPVEEPPVFTGNILYVDNPINPETIEYGENGVWTGCYNDVDYTWLEFGAEDGEFLLSHLIDGEGASWGGYYWDGFTPAIGGDKTDHSATDDGGWTTNYGGCMAGGGCVVNEDGTVTADPKKPYIVAYYSSWATEGPSNQVKFVDNDGNTEFEPVGVYVCNHPWAYYNCLNGDGPARAFAEGDYFEITAHGVASDGSEKTVSMNLVEFTDGELKAANDWTFFDLSSLGKVESVYFTLNSTDTGEYGMNTAAYFCMDRFEVKIGDSGEPTRVVTMKADKKVTSVRYSNLAGMTSDKPFDGVNVVVFTYSDGSTSSKVVIRR